ncbi:hypothetical protein ACV36R_31755, partial [Pseudomonas aeruginosa]
QRHAVLDGLHGRVCKRLRRQWKTLRAELADTTYEHWHPLRLRIKRVRYGLEAYPHDCSIPGSLLASQQPLFEVVPIAQRRLGRLERRQQRAG